MQYMYSYPHKKSYGDMDFNLLDMTKDIETCVSSLYIHLPFCSNRCGYCNLFSLCGQNDKLISSYVSNLEKETKYISDRLNLKIKKFTIGGGTPLYLKLEELERVLALPGKYFKVDSKNIFITIETSPKETTDEKLALLKKYKVDRLSIGIQSFLDEELKTLNRSHKLSHINKALELIKKYDFPILNMDLI